MLADVVLSTNRQAAERIRVEILQRRDLALAGLGEQCDRIWDYERVPQTPLWQTLLETGARWNEARLATWGDLSLTKLFLVLRAAHTKAKRQRVIPLRSDLVDQLIRLRARHETVFNRLPNVEDRIFLSPEGRPWGKPTTNAMRIFVRTLEEAEIPRVDAQGRKVDIHALRTTCASRMARNGVPLVQAQRLLGHSSPALTAAAYTDLDVEDLRGAVEGLPDLGSATTQARDASG